MSGEEERLRRLLDASMARECKLQIELEASGGSSGVVDQLERLQKRNERLERTVNDLELANGELKHSGIGGADESRELNRLRGALERKMDVIADLRFKLKEAGHLTVGETPGKSDKMKLMIAKEQLEDVRECLAAEVRRREKEEDRRGAAELEATELKKSNAKLITQLELRQDELEDVTSDYEFALSNAKREIVEQAAEIDEMHKELTKVKTISMLSLRATPVDASNARSKEIERAGHGRELAEKKLTEERHKLETAREDLKKLRQELHKLRSAHVRQISESEEQIVGLEQQVSALTNQVQFLEQENNHSLARLQKVAEANRLLKEEAEDLTEQLDEDLLQITRLKKKLGL